VTETRPNPPVRTVILGAAGRDFHNFNVALRDDPRVEVVAFTGAQIPGITGRRYPASLAGPRYPQGVPIVPETALETLIAKEGVRQVIFAYSDVTHEHVMHLASRALASGADYALLGPGHTMLRSRLPVIAVSAVRTGCGKSQVARYLSEKLRERKLRVAVLRHPMPYGDLEAARVQRFASAADLAAARCSIEEREEYEPHIAAGGTVYAGVDYAAILHLAEREADIILWDGGNNDFPFIRPDLHIVLADALRPGDETRYHPGETVLRMADIVVAAKADAAEAASVERVLGVAHRLNPRALCLRGGSPVTLAGAETLRGRRVLAIDDGPTLTHGGMAWGAGYRAAERAGAVLVDPRAFATAPIAALYRQYPHLGAVLPAVGYSGEQLAALEETIARAEVDAVVLGTPIDLAALIRIRQPVLRARYAYAELDSPGLWDAVERCVAARFAGRG
jgi:predicted GTPase